MELSRLGGQGKSQGHRTREEPSHLKICLSLTSRVKNVSTIDRIFSEGLHGDKAFGIEVFYMLLILWNLA